MSTGGIKVAGFQGTATPVPEGFQDNPPEGGTPQSIMSDTSPIAVVVTKPDPGASLGLEMRNIDGKIIVSSLLKPEIFKDTDLKVGMHIESINGTKVWGAGINDAVAIIKSAPGTVTIDAYTIAKKSNTTAIVVVVTKPNPGASLGLEMRNVDGKIIVSSLLKPEIFKDTDLKVGMHIESINGTMVWGSDISDAVAIIKSAPRTVKIYAYTIVKKSNTTPIVVVVTKANPGASLGLGMRNVGGKIIVTAFSKPEIFKDTDLKVGMHIESINGTKVTGAKLKDAVAIIGSTPGTVTFVAYTTTTNFESYVKEEFAKDFHILWKPNKCSCVVDHKQNPDECSACICPGCAQVYSYTLTSNTSSGIPKISYRDNIAGTFNRMMGLMTASSGNTMTVTGVAKMNGLVLQRCNRIENRMVMEQNNDRLVMEQNDNALGTGVPISETGVPISEVMEERVSIADEIVKLKKLHDDGLLDDEEFKSTKAKVLSS